VLKWPEGKKEFAMNTAMSLPVPAAYSLESYIQTVSNYPMLTLEEEQAHARAWVAREDVDAARKLVLSHLRVVVSVARHYLGYGLPHADLIQEGNIGLMKAVKRFDPDRGVRLVSFALHWIRAEIHEYVLRNWRLVKVATTKAQRKLFFNLRSSKKRLGWMNRAEVERIAAELKVKPEEVLQMESRLGGQDVSFSATPADGEESYVPEDYLADHSDGYAAIEQAEWQDQRETKMRDGLLALTERERDIVNRRWLNEDQKAGLQELADEYGVSAERIRQIESAAMKKMRKVIEA
jgi:RNA polymerase sigma-32 factor